MVDTGVFLDFWWFSTDSCVWENSCRLSFAHKRALFQTKIIHSRIILNLCLLAWPKIGYFLAISAVHVFWSNALRCRIYGKKCEIVLLFLKANLTFFGLRSAKKVGAISLKKRLKFASQHFYTNADMFFIDLVWVEIQFSCP